MYLWKVLKCKNLENARNMHKDKESIKNNSCDINQNLSEERGLILKSEVLRNVSFVS